jgi:hypothetical protein
MVRKIQGTRIFFIIKCTVKNVLVAIINSGKVRINFTLTNDFQDIKKDVYLHRYLLNHK